MSTMSLSPEAAAYLQSLRDQLADLPPEDRDDLLADVEVSLVESSTEGVVLEERFGPPARFAAELRAAAGFEAVPASAPRGEGFLRRAARVLHRLDEDDGVIRLRRAFAEVAPIWWLARAYVIAAALIFASVGSWSATRPELPAFGGPAGTLIVVALLIVASIAVGIRGRRRPLGGAARAAALVANLAIAALAVPAIAHGLESTRSAPVVIEVQQPQDLGPTAGLNYNGAPVENIYAFDRNGKPLYDVLLYDQNGKPLNTGAPANADPNRRVLQTLHGSLLFNSFPIRYFEPGTKIVAKPTAAPRRSAPRVATPPLKVTR